MGPAGLHPHGSQQGSNGGLCDIAMQALYPIIKIVRSATRVSSLCKMIRPSWASSTSPRPHAQCSCLTLVLLLLLSVSPLALLCQSRCCLLQRCSDAAVTSLLLWVPKLVLSRFVSLVLSPSFRLIASIHCQVLNEGVITVQDGKTLISELDVTKATCTLLMCALPVCCCCCCQCCCWRCYAKADVACHSVVGFEVVVFAMPTQMLLVVMLFVPKMLPKLQPHHPFFCC